MGITGMSLLGASLLLGAGAARDLPPSAVPVVVDLGRCTGTVVEGCVVTAAHCVPRGTREVSLRLGDGATVAMTEWELDRSRDIAVLKLPPTVMLPGASREALCADVPTGATEVAFVGFGGDGDRQRAKRLGRALHVETWTSHVTDLRWLSLLPLPSYLDAGDSGGPLLVARDASACLLGVASETLLTNLGIAGQRIDGHREDRFLPLPDTRRWLDTAFTTLRCEEGRGPRLAPAVALDGAFREGRPAGFTPVAVGDDDRRRLLGALAGSVDYDKLATLLRRLLSLPSAPFLYAARPVDDGRATHVLVLDSARARTPVAALLLRGESLELVSR